jgi:hypothetical protein
LFNEQRKITLISWTKKIIIVRSFWRYQRGHQNP